MLGLGNPQQLPSVTKNLLVINVLIFVVMLLSPLMDQKLTTYAALHYFTSPGFKLWQLVTYMFVHRGFGHLLFNMIALYFFGPPIERVLGKERFLFFYLTCGIGAALVQEGVFAWLIHGFDVKYGSAAVAWVIDHSWAMFSNGSTALSGDALMEGVRYGVITIGDGGYSFVPGVMELIGIANTPTVGASGAIFGILGAAAMLFPNARVYLYFAIPMKLKWLVVGYAVLELIQGIGGYATTVAHFAHLGGLLVSILLVLYWKKKGFFNDKWFF